MKTYNCFSVPINTPFLMILALTLSIDNLHSQSYTPRFEYYNNIGGLQASDTNIQQLQIKTQNDEIEVKEIKLPCPNPEPSITCPPNELCNMLICPQPCKNAIGIIK